MIVTAFQGVPSRHFVCRALTLVALLCVTSGGCNLIGVAAYKTLPPPKEPAAYKLGEASTSVSVKSDETLTGAHGPLDAEVVAVALERALERHTTAQVEGYKTDSFATRRIVVNLLASSIEPVLGSDYRQGAAAARVRVLDADGAELWPADGSEGWPVEARLPQARAPSDDGLRRATLRALGEQIAALFYAREIAQ